MAMKEQSAPSSGRLEPFPIQAHEARPGDRFGDFDAGMIAVPFEQYDFLVPADRDVPADDGDVGHLTVQRDA